MSRPFSIAWSSCVYPLEAGDLAALPEYSGPAISPAALPEDSAIVFIRPDGPDCLLRGAAEIRTAAEANPHFKIPVRFVFKPKVPRWNLIGSVVRAIRNRYRFNGTATYHVSPADVRSLGLERAVRSSEAPQLRAGADRIAAMTDLRENLLRDGYDDSRPITVMLCRTHGRKDSLRQGHHRVALCLECGIKRMAVRFAAAGAVARHRSDAPFPA